MIDFAHMKNKTDFNKTVTIEVINHYLVVRSLVYGITISVGKFNPFDVESLLPSTQAIGEAVYKVLIAIENQEKFRTEPMKSVTMITAGKILNVSISTVRRLIDAGHIDCQITAGGHRKPYINHVYRYKNLNMKPIPEKWPIDSL